MRKVSSAKRLTLANSFKGEIASNNNCCFKIGVCWKRNIYLQERESVFESVCDSGSLITFISVNSVGWTSRPLYICPMVEKPSNLPLDYRQINGGLPLNLREEKRDVFVFNII